MIFKGETPQFVKFDISCYNIFNLTEPANPRRCHMTLPDDTQKFDILDPNQEPSDEFFEQVAELMRQDVVAELDAENEERAARISQEIEKAKAYHDAL